MDTIHFKNSQSHDIPSTEVKYKMVNGRSLISFYDYLDNSILIYDLSTDSCMKVNVQNAIGPNMSILADYMINGYFIRSLDSIYVLLNPLNEIHLIDSNGSWLKRWVVSSERPGTNRGYYLLSFFGDAPIEMIGDDLVTLQQLPDPDYGVNQSLRKIKYSSFIDAVIAFDGDTAKVVSQIGRWPVLYQGDYFNDVTPCRTINNRHQVVYSFGVSDSLFIWNTDRLLRTAKINSPEGLHFKSFDGVQETNPQYMDRYIVEEPRYRKLLYDSYRHVYYRIVAMSQQYKNKQNQLNLYEDKPWSIQILNNDLSLMGLVKMEPHMLDFETVLVTPKGLMVRLNQSHDESNPDKDPTFLLYALDSLH